MFKKNVTENKSVEAKSEKEKEMSKMKKIVLIVVVVVLGLGVLGSVMEGNSEDTTKSESSATEQTQNTEQSEAEANEAEELPGKDENACRALTKKFVKNVVNEDYHIMAFNVKSFDLADNGEGTIEVLYMPEKESESKVNLTISKTVNTVNGTTDAIYTITYALLNGLYEFDLNEVQADNKMTIAENVGE